MGGRGELDVDGVWLALGQWGRYQLWQLVVMLVSIWSCGFHVLSVVFIGYRPDYSCSEVPIINDTEPSNYSVSVERVYGECSIRTYTNDSGHVSMGETGCLYGYNYSIAPETSFVTEWGLVCEKKQLTEVSQTLMMMGQAVGAFIFTSLADRYGRKPVHVGCHILLVLITMATAFIPNYSGFAALRFLTGAVQQGVGLTCAILNLEMFPKEIRGYMEVLGLLFWTTGIALVTPISYLLKDVSWRYLQLTLSLLSSWALIEWWLIDESLRWLIANGRIKEAKAILKKACKRNNKNFEEILTVTNFREFELHSFASKSRDVMNGDVGHSTEDIEDDYTESKDETNHVTEYQEKTAALIAIEDDTQKQGPVKKYTVLDLVKSRQLLITSLIMWFAWITNSVTYYGIMLISSSLAGNRFVNFFLGSIAEYPASFIEFMMINRYGRRPTSIFFHALCGVALIIATVLTTTAGGNAAMLIASTVFTLVGKMAITGSFSTIFLYTPELYPTNMRYETIGYSKWTKQLYHRQYNFGRNVGIGLSSCAARVGAMMAPFSRNLADEVAWAPGLIFGVMCACVAFLTLWIPETNQYELPQTLTECEVWYKHNRFKLPGCRRRKDTHSDHEVDRALADNTEK